MSATATPADVLAGDAAWCVVCGDATEVMAALPDGCAHVTYCDPPYGLSAQSTDSVVACLTAWLAGEAYTHGPSGFMGKSWDAFVPGPEAWREVHRCLRPGGYCVAFSSTRTVDLLGIAVRLAGFEMREGMAYIGGQGFPKSLNVSKAIDEEAGATREVIGTWKPTGTARVKGGQGGATEGMVSAAGELRDELPITAPASPAAVQWDGYGTTTKPAFEPLIVARKALDGTVAHNVQTHGCGALNIDAARIAGTKPVCENTSGAEGMFGLGSRTAAGTSTVGRFPASLALVHDEGCVCEGTRRVTATSIHGEATAIRGAGTQREAGGSMTFGRVQSVKGHADPDGMESVDAWRCTDTCAVAELGRQSGESASSDRPRNNTAAAQALTPSMGGAAGGWTTNGHADAGTAARFFYQAKASARDRLAFITCTAGCAHHETVAGVKAARDSARDPSREHPHGFCRACGAVRNHYQHPTVKPLDLARYHARLLSLPAHTRPVALVPFCGTGIEARALLDVGFRVIAIDLDPRHCTMTAHRLSGGAEVLRAIRPRAATAPAEDVPPAVQLSLFERVA